MKKLYVLGTGYALATKCYNTCFALKNDAGTLLVDAGGGNGILSQMEKAGLDFADVHHMIVTHAHCDHVLGVVWVIRKIGTMMQGGKYDGDLTIYCHESVAEGVTAMCQFTLQKKFVKLLGDRIRFEVISDGHEADVCGCHVTFFDILSTKLLQYGCAAWATSPTTRTARSMFAAATGCCVRRSACTETGTSSSRMRSITPR